MDKHIKEKIMRKITLAVLLSAFAAAPAVAADFYAGVKLGQANYNYNNLTKNNPTGFGVFGGYAINDNVAVEVEYVDLGSIASATTTGKTDAWGVSTVGSYPFSEQFSVFGKLGFARTTIKSTSAVATATAKTTSVTYGLGGQYNFNPSAGVRLSWDRYKMGDAVVGVGKANLYSIGGIFKF